MTHTKTSTLDFITFQTCFPNFQLKGGDRPPLAPLLPTHMVQEGDTVQGMPPGLLHSV